MQETLADIADFVWSYPVVGLCLLSAVYFTLRLGLIQIRALPHAVALLMGRHDREGEKGVISHFQALSAALSGTIGIGNIGGVAIAIGVGGPGAVLWMWVMGLFGMATKYVECTLGTHYRTEDPITGEVRGGPMHYITAGLGPRWRPISYWYAAAIALAGFGFSSMFQSNQAAAALAEHHDVPRWLTGAVLFVLGGLTIMGGIRRIGHVAARLVPAMCVTYVLGALAICVLHIDEMPRVVWVILEDGFTGEAAAGGAVGSVVAWGVRRAVFSNEAGLGSASIAHAAVRTNYPIREGIVASLEPLLDTIIVSGATASIIVLSGNYGAQMYQPSGASLEPVGRLASAEPGPVEVVPANDLLLDLPSSASPGPLGIAYHRVRGDLSAQWLDAEGRMLGEVALARTHAEATPTSVGCDVEGAWARCVLLAPDPAVGASARMLRLAGGEGARWEVGRVEPVAKLEGIALTSMSFERYIPGFGSWFIAFAGFLFAFSTMVTWSYYGETATAYLFSPRVVPVYRFAFVAAAFVGAVNELGVVVSFSDIMVGLLVIPNTVAILAMSGRVAGWTREYFSALAAGERPPDPHRLHEPQPPGSA